MEEHVLIETPEHLELQFDLAGVGSRFVAGLADLFVQIALVLLIWLVAVLVAGALGVTLGSMATEWVVAVAILAVSVVLVGYYIFFEMLWSGQSPGKRWTGLRVLHADGTPLNFYSSLVRNVVRIADFLPGTYTVGLLVMFFHGQYRRLGDVAAGTIVVKERAWQLPGMQGPPAELPEPGPEVAALVGPSLSRFTGAEVALVADFVERRQQLELPARARVAAAMAVPLLRRLGAESWLSTPGAYEPFLEGLVALYRRRSEGQAVASQGEQPPPDHGSLASSD